jgi:hypothetical protein
MTLIPIAICHHIDKGTTWNGINNTGGLPALSYGDAILQPQSFNHKHQIVGRWDLILSFLTTGLV